MEEKFREIMMFDHIEVDYTFYTTSSNGEVKENYTANLYKGGYALEDNSYVSKDNLDDLLDTILEILKAL